MEVGNTVKCSPDMRNDYEDQWKIGSRSVLDVSVKNDRKVATKLIISYSIMFQSCNDIGSCGNCAHSILHSSGIHQPYIGLC